MLQSRMVRYITLVVLLASGTLVVFLISRGQRTSGTDAVQRPQPFRIGVLTESWGPTPHVTGLRDGLLALGYREHEQFAMGVRFTQGDIAALPAAARELVQYGVDVLFAVDENPTKAAQRSMRPSGSSGAASPATGRTFTKRAAKRLASWTRSSRARSQQAFPWK